jgi:hypothetical protein
MPPHRRKLATTLAAQQPASIPCVSCVITNRSGGGRAVLFHRVYQLAARMPDPCRVDGRAFRNAFCKLMGMVGWLPDSSDRIPCLEGWVGSLFRHYRRQFRGSQVYKALFGEEKGYQKAWSPDHVGWTFVNPEEHFGEDGRERVRERLSRLLAGRDHGTFCRMNAWRMM